MELDAACLVATDCIFPKNSDSHLWIPVENCASVSSCVIPGTCIGIVTAMFDEATEMPPVAEAQYLGVNVKAFPDHPCPFEV